MESILDDFAVRFIWSALIILVGLFLLLTVYIIVKRFLLNRWQAKRDEAEKRILPRLYKYIDGEASELEIGGELSDRFDIVAAFSNINDMIDNLEGDEKARLKELLDLQQFKQFYLKKLHSNKPVQIAKACMYFEKKNITDTAVIRRLQQLQHHSYSVIGYSSTLALINTSNQRLRDNALKAFLMRTNNSSLSVSDIIFKYYSYHTDKERAANTLFSQISDENIPAKSVAPIISMLPELGLFGLADTLFEHFQKPLKHDDSGIVTAAIIRDFNEFSFIDILPVLKEKQTWESSYQNVRLATAYWMRKNYRAEFDEMLIKLANDTDLEVRIAAQAALLQSDRAENMVSFLKSAFVVEWNDIKKTRGQIADYH